jgi:SHS2 domain-containing protein
MSKQPAGFREHEHTADWELEVWAPDLSGLLEQAALGMYQLSGTHLAGSPRLVTDIRLRSPDIESLLVEFLQELLYLGEVEGLGFDKFDIAIDNLSLMAKLTGSPITSIQKEIKAVTYHNLKVIETGRHVEVRIVFDV